MTGTESKPRSKISDEERTELMKQMDKDLEEHFAKIEARDAKGLFLDHTYSLGFLKNIH